MKIQRQFLGSPISQLQSPWLTKATCILGKYQKSKQNKLKTDLVSSSTNKTKPKILIENSINQISTWKALLTVQVTRLLYQSYSISHVSSLFDLRSGWRREIVCVIHQWEIKHLTTEVECLAQAQSDTSIRSYWLLVYFPWFFRKMKNSV